MPIDPDAYTKCNGCDRRAEMVDGLCANCWRQNYDLIFKKLTEERGRVLSLMDEWKEMHKPHTPLDLRVAFERLYIDVAQGGDDGK